MISPQQIQDVKTRSNIVEIIGQYVQLKKAGGSYKGLCPFHNEKSPSFNVNAADQIFHCFGCGISGDAISFIREMEKLEFLDAVKFLADRAGVVLVDEKDSGFDPQKLKEIKKGKDRLVELMKNVAQFYVEQLHTADGKIALDYLNKRGIDAETARKFQLGYSPNSYDSTLNFAQKHGYSRQDLYDAGLLSVKENETLQRGYDRFRGRLMFPIANESGLVVAFSARTLTDEMPKYVNSPETSIFVKSKILYGFHLAKNSFRSKGFAIICEGQLDVIACHRAGLDNAVASQGTAFTEEHAALLHRFVDKVIVGFDSDNAGAKATERVFEILLRQNITMSATIFPQGDDPDGIFKRDGAEVLQKYFIDGVDFFDYLIERFNAKSFESEADKSQALNSIIEKINLIEDHILREVLLQKCSEKLHIPESVIRSVLKTIKRTQKEENSDEKIENKYFHSKEDIAKLQLLKYGLSSQLMAYKLAYEIPFSAYTTDQIGLALGAFIGSVLHGEWENSGQVLMSLLDKNIESSIVEIIINREIIDEDLDQNKKRAIEKAINDCLSVLKLFDIETEVKVLQQQFVCEINPVKKSELWLRINDLTTLRKQHNVKFTPLN